MPIVTIDEATNDIRRFVEKSAFDSFYERILKYAQPELPAIKSADVEGKILIHDLFCSVCETTVIRQFLDEIAMLMGYEITRDLPLEDVEIETPVTKTVAQKIGGNLSQETLELKDKYDRLMAATDAKTQALKQKYEKVVDAADFKMSEWREKYDKLMNSRDRSVERLLKAFPYIRSTSYSESMEALKRRLKVIYNKSKINSTFKEAENTTEIPCCGENENCAAENAEPETVQKM